MARRLALALFALPAALGSAAVDFEKNATWSVRQTSSITSFRKDSQGNLYAMGWVAANPTIFKFDVTGAFLYARAIPVPAAPDRPPKLVPGPDGHLYVVGSKIVRVDGAAGTVDWSIGNADIEEPYVDEHGDLYGSSYTLGRVVKRSKIDGHALYTVPGHLIPLTGPTFLIADSNGLYVASKQTGDKLSPVILTPTPTGPIFGLTMRDGKAFLMSGSRAYGYKPVGMPINLGVIYPNPILAEDGSVVTQTFPGVARYDDTFHRTWSNRDPSLLENIFADDQDVYTRTLHEGFHVSRLSTGTLRFTLPDDGDPIATHAGQIWVASHTTSELIIAKFDPITGSWRDGWHYSSEAPGAGEPVLGGFGPFGDLMLVTQLHFTTNLVRISSTGVVRWSLEFPQSLDHRNPDGGSAAGMSFSGDRKTAMVWLNTDQGRLAYEIDTVAGAIKSQSSGYACIDGTSVYRSGPTHTSKYDLATGLEVWRIPRTGLISIGKDHEVYVGNTRNRPDNGGLVWRANVPALELVPLGDRLAAFLPYRHVAYLNNATGAALWDTQLGEGSDLNFFASAHRQRGQVVVRYPMLQDFWSLDERTGGLVVQGAGSGFWDKIGRFLWQEPDSTLFRAGSFGIPGAPVSQLSRSYGFAYSDEKSIAYLVGWPTADGLPIARLSGL